jgi:hypothetical protein
MKAPDRKCMYCQQLMVFAEDHYYAGSAHYIYMCQPCQSQQNVSIQDDKVTYYNFQVGQYKVCFCPPYNSFYLQIIQPGYWDIILELNILPNWTPQNTTEERIKLLLLFS